MRDLLSLIRWMLLGRFRSKASHEAEIFARHQLNVLRRTSPRRPVFSNFDRMIFVCLYRIALRILDAITIVEHRDAVRFQVAGRHGDNESLDFPASLLIQLMCDRRDMMRRSPSASNRSPVNGLGSLCVFVQVTFSWLHQRCSRNPRWDAAMQKLVRCLIVILLTAFAAPVHAQQQEKRVALVIGNSAYSGAALPTAANDAGLVAQTLQAAGFDVAGARDLDATTLRSSLREFVEKASASGPETVALVYFAGYGVQFEGENYVVPVDARIA